MNQQLSELLGCSASKARMSPCRDHYAIPQAMSGVLVLSRPQCRPASTENRCTHFRRRNHAPSQATRAVTSRSITSIPTHRRNDAPPLACIESCSRPPNVGVFKPLRKHGNPPHRVGGFQPLRRHCEPRRRMRVLPSRDYYAVPQAPIGELAYVGMITLSRWHGEPPSSQAGSRTCGGRDHKAISLARRGASRVEAATIWRWASGSPRHPASTVSDSRAKTGSSS